ncbi:MAG TPA: WYL domain-containing protein [Burkholderiaceae bacterium]
MAHVLQRVEAVGSAEARGDRRDRLHAVEPVPASFGRPDGFDALQYVRHAISTLPRAHSVNVLLHTDLATAHQRLFTEIGTLEYQASTGREAQPTVLWRSEADDLDWFMRELARLPFHFDVLAPDELRLRLERHARQLLLCVRKRPLPAGERAG